MTARSLRDIVKMEGKISSLLLKSSKDLVCTNLWCEKVTGPCICRLQRTLDKVDLSMLTKLDLSGNKLTELPPAVKDMVSLEELDLSDNAFVVEPPELSKLSLLKFNLDGNPCAQSNTDFNGSKD
jgi:Leucine-rich repeat (LRR) protein